MQKNYVAPAPRTNEYMPIVHQDTGWTEESSTLSQSISQIHFSVAKRVLLIMNV